MEQSRCTLGERLGRFVGDRPAPGDAAVFEFGIDRLQRFAIAILDRAPKLGEQAMKVQRVRPFRGFAGLRVETKAGQLLDKRM